MATAFAFLNSTTLPLVLLAWTYFLVQCFALYRFGKDIQKCRLYPGSNSTIFELMQRAQEQAYSRFILFFWIGSDVMTWMPLCIVGSQARNEDFQWIHLMIPMVLTSIISVMKLYLIYTWRRSIGNTSEIFKCPRCPHKSLRNYTRQFKGPSKERVQLMNRAIFDAYRHATGCGYLDTVVASVLYRAGISCHYLRDYCDLHFDEVYRDPLGRNYYERTDLNSLEAGTRTVPIDESQTPQLPPPLFNTPPPAYIR